MKHHLVILELYLHDPVVNVYLLAIMFYIFLHFVDYLGLFGVYQSYHLQVWINSQSSQSQQRRTRPNLDKCQVLCLRNRNVNL